MSELSGMNYISDYKGYRIYQQDSSFSIMDGSDLIERPFGSKEDCEQFIDNINLFQYLRNNMSIDIEEGSGRDYSGPGGLSDYRSIKIKLILIDPVTDKPEVISQQSFSM